jgi:PHP family Zn ribbon phosphoesterase
MRPRKKKRPKRTARPKGSYSRLCAKCDRVFDIRDAREMSWRCPSCHQSLGEKGGGDCLG